MQSSVPGYLSPPADQNYSFSCDVMSEVIVTYYNKSNYRGCKHTWPTPVSHRERSCKKDSEVNGTYLICPFFLRGGFVVLIILQCVLRDLLPSAT